MSNLSVNTLNNEANTVSVLVEDLGNFQSTGWNGKTITQAEVEAMGVTVQGTGFSALIYPDGSIVGSTSSSNFEMRANGSLHCSSQVFADANGVVTVVYAISFIDITFKTNANTYTASSNRSCTLGAHTETSSLFYVFDAASVGISGAAVDFNAFGRWK